MRYGFIGLGNLGGHLAASLIAAGFDVVVHDQEQALADRHLAAGGTWAGSPAELAAGVDAVITCLPSPAVSEAVLMEILTTLRRGGTWIEVSTLGRDDILRLATIAEGKGIRVMEAPVTGGVHLAAQGKITVLGGATGIYSTSTSPRFGRWGARFSTWAPWVRRRSSR